MSAPASGHGKTAIAVGLLAALTARGVPTAGFKVGPDHTDAAYLGLAAGRPGRNLDPRLVGAQRVAPLFAHGAAGAQLAVIEGAMGLFDSLTGQPEIDGTAAVAATLRAPVVLVVDVAAMGHSLAALVHGFRMFDEMVHLGGVILNRVASPRHEQMLRSAMDDIGMPVLGALHRGDLPSVLPARVHGLVPVAHRTVEAGRAVRRLGEAVAGMLDMDRLMALAGSAPTLPGPIWTPAEVIGGEVFDQRPLIALAGGQGAPYTYVETAELLTAAGADVAVVDPLRDEALPAGTRALIVGAGLPEGYAEELSANHRLSADVAQFARDGWPVVAEGIALSWLGRELDGRPMCGVLDATAATGEQTVAGYREATAPGTSVLAPAGARITGYKHHRAIVAPRAGANPAWTWSGGNPEGFVWRQVHASQLGLHWAAAPEIANRLVAAALAGPQTGSPSGPGPSGPGGPVRETLPSNPAMQPGPAMQPSPAMPPGPGTQPSPVMQPSPAMASGQPVPSGFSGPPAGPSGPPNQAGFPGPQSSGAPGHAGFPGPAGSSGAPGHAGFPGPAGSSGAPGHARFPGPAGSSGAPSQADFPGSAGPSGAPGQGGFPASGPSAHAGPAGAPGQGGFPGSGHGGAPGPSGAPGHSGFPSSGPSGHAGPSGTPGQGGYPGTGPSGAPGHAGFSGPPGPTGFPVSPAGQAGPPGPMPPLPGTPLPPGPVPGAHGPGTGTHGPGTGAHGPGTGAHGPGTGAHGPGMPPGSRPGMNSALPPHLGTEPGPGPVLIPGPGTVTGPGYGPGSAPGSGAGAPHGPGEGVAPGSGPGTPGIPDSRPTEDIPIHS
ncbi:cobyrinate a,c-diamide synthase [Actinoplanes sp. NBC_00393]|uniref:cobyrinate a,c-diamide synthase n=1 Tax=Actinoplanes sp. NBC_00393 TaxID=2975953 RepID=UPI002E1FBAEB